MFFDWIIVGAIVVLFAGVVLAFRFAEDDAPSGDVKPDKPTHKRKLSDT